MRQNLSELEPSPPFQDFSKLVEEVIFSISGIVNPERTELWKMALDMGSQYRPGVLIPLYSCAPLPTLRLLTKCRQPGVLLFISATSKRSSSPLRCTYSTLEKSRKLSASWTIPLLLVQECQLKQREGDLKNLASPVDVQQWVLEDLAATLTWLERQNDKPEENELEAVAAQGLLVCLEDAIRSLQENKGLSLVMDNWAFIPRAVKELAVYEKDGQAIKDQLIAEGERFKVIYESQLKKLGFGVPSACEFESRTNKSEKDENDAVLDTLKAGPTEETEKIVDDDATEILSDSDSRDPADFDTDNTEELNEDEITSCKEKILYTFGLD